MWQLQDQAVHSEHIWPTATLPIDLLTPNLMRSSLPQSQLVVKVWSNSVNKYPRNVASNVSLELKRMQKNACTDTLEK